MNSQGSATVAACALLAAASGVVAASIEPSPAPAVYALTPAEFTEWVKAICNNIFTIVNTLIGLYNLLQLGQATVSRRRGRRQRSKPTPSGGPAPHTEPTGGA